MQSKEYLQCTSIASMTAQILTKLIVHPIDTLKTKQQITIAGENQAQNGINQTIKNTIKNEGYRGFYKGVFISAFGSAPAFGLYMTTYQYYKGSLQQFEFLKQNDGLRVFIAGMLAEVVGCLIWLPVDIVKERLQVQSNLKIYNYKNGIDAIKTILNSDGVKGIYRGYGASLAYFGPWSAFYFYFYEKYKKTFMKEKPKFFESFFWASAAGVSSSFLVNSIDVVKVRLQVQRSIKSNPNQSYQAGNYGYKNVFHGIYKLFQKEGIQGFVKGFGAKFLLIAPSTACSMGFTENIRSVLLQKGVFKFE